jgi:hypothetical protein
VEFRALCGWDEAYVDSINSIAATHLLGRLVEASDEESLTTAGCLDLSLCQRDALIAQLYRRDFGDVLTSTVNCVSCASPYDVDFSLSTLLTQVHDSSASAAKSMGVSESRSPENGATVYTLGSGLSFRMPTTRDQIAVRALANRAKTELLRRCTLSAGPLTASANTYEEVEQAIDGISTQVNLELSSECTECSASQLMHFDLGKYWLRAIVAGRATLDRDVHLMAAHYGWSLESIMGLARDRRRHLVGMIEMDRRSLRRRLA